MKACPKCQEAPWWHLARNVSRRERSYHFALGGCPHALTFGRQFGIISDCVRSYHEAKWDQYAEEMFAEITTPRMNEKGEITAWNEVEREAFRARIHPKPKTDPE